MGLLKSYESDKYSSEDTGKILRFGEMAETMTVCWKNFHDNYPILREQQREIQVYFWLARAGILYPTINLVISRHWLNKRMINRHFQRSTYNVREKNA